MSATPLLLLTRYRWSVPVMAHLDGGDGDRFGAIAGALAVGRDSLTRTLRGLQGPGWVAREPERRGRYALTDAGAPVARACAGIAALVDADDAADLAYRRWSLPIVAALRGWRLRFGELRAILDDVTPRALTLALKQLEAGGLVAREIEGGYPPTACYRLTARATPLLPHVLPLTGDR